MTVYFYRHQAGGIVTDFAFRFPPDEVQLAPMREAMVRLHGKRHPRTKFPYWDRVVEIPLLDSGELPTFADPDDGSFESLARQPEFAVAGTGNVRNP